MAHRFLTSFKDFADFDVATTDNDTSLSLCLTSAEAYLQDTWGIVLKLTSISEKIDGTGNKSIYTKYRIQTLTSVSVDDVADTDMDNYSVRGNKIRFLNSSATTGIDNVIVGYTAGYDDSAVPSNLLLALYKLANKLYTDMSEDREGVSGFQTNTKTGIDYIPKKFPDNFFDLIHPYRIFLL